MRVRVLVVDDSAFARKVLRETLGESPEIEVIGTARDGLDALEKIDALKPDVITLDLVMPNLDGLTMLSSLSPAQRRRVIVVSMADGESDLGIAALGQGIFDLVHKPTALALSSLADIREELTAKVLLAAAQASRAALAESAALRPTPTFATASERVVLIGTSTGGPQALTRLLRELPADFPAPIVIVLHIPVGYTGPLAERLNAECAIDVVEAHDGLLLRPGLAVVARAGLHLRLKELEGGLGVLLDASPRDTIHRPAVDVLFESAAFLGRRALGVVLTGMGEDGLAGARVLAAAGGRILTESEASCVVYGMPRAIKVAGLSDGEAPLAGMAAEIAARL